MHIYEYLFAALIVVVILITSSIIASSMPDSQLSASDKEQVKTASEKILTQILLSPGQPYDWGSNIGITSQCLQSFGLAKYGESTREAYTLDLDKVQRLGVSQISPLYINPTDAASKMNLNTTVPELSLSNNFGFTLEIHPVLNVTVQAPINNVYNVGIISEYQISPIANARVDALLFFRSQDTIQVANASGSTGFDGTCSLQFGNSPPGILALSTTYLGIHVSRVYDFGNNIEANWLGDSILMNSGNSLDASNITEIIATQQNGTYVMSIFNSSASTDGINYRMNFNEPSAFALIALSSDGATLTFAARNINVVFSTIPSISTSNSYALLSYSLERTVKVADTTCTARLLLWRMTY